MVTTRLLRPRSSAPRARGWRLLAILVLGAASTACEHPIAVVTPHAEAADLVLVDSIGAQVVVETRDNREWRGGPLTVCEGETRTLVPRVLDFRGAAIDLLARRDLDVRGEVDRPNAAWEPLRGRGRLSGLAAGRTRMRFLLWHLTHADLITPWIDVDVLPTALCRRP